MAFSALGPVHPAGAGRADHHGQLGLVLDLVRLRRDPDRVVRADHRGGRLDEDQRLLRHLVAQLGGVLGVVAADADHLAGEDRREQPDVGQGPALTGEAHLLERETADLGDGQALDAGTRLTLDDSEGHATGMNKTSETHGKPHPLSDEHAASRLRAALRRPPAASRGGRRHKSGRAKPIRAFLTTDHTEAR
nr:hypothetical protein GCM10020092_016930 [Actinoplanes digitatis]